MLDTSALLLLLKTRMQNRITSSYSDGFLLGEIANAMYKVAERRFVPLEELEDKYAYNIVDLALYNIALIGGDFQTSHSENGVSRSFLTEAQILKNIMPKAKGF